ncbi:MAG: hypothetical protein HZB56_01735 [Deltaproteobacteria bacterium]|nr:hypothetical protein [Deltaproteobacteria bacterium]
MNTLVHRFVDQVPEVLEDGVLYVSIRFSTVIHKCCCGCGHEIVTPLSRKTGWQLTFDGESISLHPSIGNRALPCRSHYWIESNKVVWAGWRDAPKAKKPQRGRGLEGRTAIVHDDQGGHSAPEPNEATSGHTPQGLLRRWLHRD